MLLTVCRFRVLAGGKQGARDAAAAARRGAIDYSEQLTLDYESGPEGGGVLLLNHSRAGLIVADFVTQLSSGRACEKVKTVVNSLKDVSRPYAFTVQEIVVPASSRRDGVLNAVGVEVEVPHILAGHQVQFYPLPDSDEKAFFNVRNLRIEGAIIEQPGPDGRVKLRIL